MKIRHLLLIGALALPLAGCANNPYASNGTTADTTGGAALGALAGAVIGNQDRSTAGGRGHRCRRGRPRWLWRRAQWSGDPEQRAATRLLCTSGQQSAVPARLRLHTQSAGTTSTSLPGRVYLHAE